MSQPEVPFLPTGDEISDRIQKGQTDQVNRIGKIPFNNGILLESVSLASGNTDVSHKLGRKFQGYLILKQTASATIYNNQGSTDDTKFLRLNASGATTVNIWVF